MTPVAVFVAVTVTPGIKAPDASVTVPPTVAFIDWLNAAAEKINNTKVTIKDPFIESPPSKVTVRFFRECKKSTPFAKMNQWSGQFFTRRARAAFPIVLLFFHD